MNIKNTTAVLVLVAACAILTGCAGAQRQEIRTSDPRVEKIVITSAQEVDDNCRVDGGRDDEGNIIPDSAVFNGCFRPDTLTIWINQGKNIMRTLRHELCHAISGMNAADCEKAFPYEMKYSMPGEGVGGHWGAPGSR